MTPSQKKLKKIFRSVSTNKNVGLVQFGGEIDAQKGDGALARQMRIVLYSRLSKEEKGLS